MDTLQANAYGFILGIKELDAVQTYLTPGFIIIGRTGGDTAYNFNFVRHNSNKVDTMLRVGHHDERLYKYWGNTMLCGIFKHKLQFHQNDPGPNFYWRIQKLSPTNLKLSYELPDTILYNYFTAK